MKKYRNHALVLALLIGAILLNGLTVHWDDQGDNHPRVKRPQYSLTT